MADGRPGCMRANPALLSVLTNPNLGESALCVVDDLAPSTAAAVLMIGGAPIGFPLDTVGAPGCELRVDAALGTFPMALSAGVGRAELGVPIPNDPGLIGASIELQAALAVPGINALGADLSNGGRLTVGRRVGLPVTRGLVAHFDASDPSGNGTLPLDGEPVAIWRDLSSLTLDALASPAAPVFRRAGLNDRPAIDFSTRGDDGLQTTDSNSLDGTDWTVFLVGQDPVTALFSMGVKDRIDHEILLFSRSGGNMRAFHHTSPGNFYELPHQNDVVAGEAFVQEAAFDQAVTAVTNVIDGVPTTVPGLVRGRPGPFPNAIDRAIHIGRRGDVRFENGAGLVAEILVFSRILTSSERDAVGGYLATKYEILTQYP